MLRGMEGGGGDGGGQRGGCRAAAGGLRTQLAADLLFVKVWATRQPDLNVGLLNKFLTSYPPPPARDSQATLPPPPP